MPRTLVSLLGLSLAAACAGDSNSPTVRAGPPAQIIVVVGEASKVP